MSCPDWRALAAARDRSPRDPAGWEDAVAHLDGCPECRRAAVVADPTLAFRRLPPLAVAADEVEAMRLRVATLRGAADVVAPPRRRASWRLAAAAAVAALAAFAGGNAPQGFVPVRVAALAPPPAHAPAATSRAFAAELASEPLLEGLDKPFDQVVQWNGDDLSVILVVDQRLGV